MPRINALQYDFKKLEQMAEYIIETKCTIRQCGKEFGVAHSTLDRRFNAHLKELNFKLYQDLKVVLDNNFKERAIRGGEVGAKRSRESNEEIFKLFAKYTVEKDNIVIPHIIKEMISEDIQLSKGCVSNHINKLIKKKKIKIKNLSCSLAIVEFDENK